MNTTLIILIILFSIPALLYTFAFSIGLLMMLLDFVFRGLVTVHTRNELLRHLKANINELIISYCILGILILIKMW